MVGNDLIDDPLQHKWGKQPEEASGRDAEEGGEVKREQRSNLFGEPAEFIRHARRNTAFPHGDRVDSEFSNRDYGSAIARVNNLRCLFAFPSIRSFYADNDGYLRRLHDGVLFGKAT